MTIAHSIFLIHLACTLIMCGAIWLAQLSTYPLFAFVGPEYFLQYEREHVRRISFIAWFVITLELLTGALMIIVPLPKMHPALPFLGFALILFLWCSTWIVQYPIHRKLMEKFCPELHRKLVQSNWQRVVAWTLRSFLMMYMLTLLLQP